MKSIVELLDIMATLRDPEAGCPWDRAQTFTSILPYTFEEVYELANAIDKNDMEGLCDELGDLLFHIVYYAQMAKEKGYFDFNTLSINLINKIQRRHPHVFDDSEVLTAEQQSLAWEMMKQNETHNLPSFDNDAESLLDGISHTQPAFIRAHKLQKRAACVGFDWNEIENVLDKIEEEAKELRDEINAGSNNKNLTEEYGDLLFACVNFARHAGIDSETALRRANRKFEQRFNFIETEVSKQDKKLTEVSLDEMETLWRKAKELEEVA